MMSSGLHPVKRLFEVRVQQRRRDAHLSPQLEKLEVRTVPRFLLPGPFPVGTSPRAVVAADVNADGRPDLITANKADNDVSVLLGNGDGTFQAARTFAAGSRPYSVAVADV